MPQTARRTVQKGSVVKQLNCHINCHMQCNTLWLVFQFCTEAIYKFYCI